MNVFMRKILELKLEKFLFFNLLMDFHPLIKGDVVVYGAGKLGRLLFKTFKHSPVAFIDIDKTKQYMLGKPVFHLDGDGLGSFLEGKTVVVTPVWEFDIIAENIKCINDNINVVSLESLLEKL